MNKETTYPQGSIRISMVYGNDWPDIQEKAALYRNLEKKGDFYASVVVSPAPGTPDDGRYSLEELKQTERDMSVAGIIGTHLDRLAAQADKNRIVNAVRSGR